MTTTTQTPQNSNVSTFKPRVLNRTHSELNRAHAMVATTHGINCEYHHPKAPETIFKHSKEESLSSFKGKSERGFKSKFGKLYCETHNQKGLPKR